MVSFDRVVKGLMTGAFAVFSAKRNGHVATLRTLRHDSDPARIERVYDCKDDSLSMRGINMNKWQHTFVMTFRGDKVSVHDELLWPCCKAQRSYTLTGREEEIVRRDEEWQLDITSSTLHRSLKRGIVGQLRKADRKIFWEFVNSCDADGGDGGCSADEREEEIHRHLMRVLQIWDY